MSDNFEPSADLSRLLGYAEQDDTNLSLIADAARRAFEEGGFAVAETLLSRHAEIAPLPPQLTNLWGLAALRAGNAGRAARLFQSLIDDGTRDPGLLYNRAWCHALAGEHEEALELLADDVLAASPQAAALCVESLHRLGRPDEALERGADFAERWPDYPPLFGALANAALDDDDREAATRYAARAGDSDAGRAARGMLMLAATNPDEALAEFDALLAVRPGHTRARLGRGLALLAKGEQAPALRDIDAAAEGFGRHIGSWIAAGWLHLVAGDPEAGRQRFEKAMAIDDSFAETHGGLAVIDILDGDLESAARRAETAQRLDRASFGGALAKSLLAQAEGDAETARRIVEIAMAQPAGPGGETIAEAMARMGMRG